MYAPSPDKLVALPSKNGELLGSSAHLIYSHGITWIQDMYQFVPSPVVIWLAAFVPAFVPKHLLEGPCKVSMP
jgi:hypothetical protein